MRKPLGLEHIRVVQVCGKRTTGPGNELRPSGAIGRLPILRNEDIDPEGEEITKALRGVQEGSPCDCGTGAGPEP